MNHKRLLYNVFRSSQRSIAVFRNFKNQSQRFMTIFGIMYRYKKTDNLGRV